MGEIGFGDVAFSHSDCEMVYWFSKSSEQYRIRGKVQFVGNDDSSDAHLRNQRAQQWGNLSDSAREQFFWPEPGIAYTGPPTVPTGGRDQDGNVIQPPPSTFLLMLLHPMRVDYLRLTDNYRQVDELVSFENGLIHPRIDINEESSWKYERVN